VNSDKEEEMTKEMYILVGTFVGVLAAYITARLTVKHQLLIAELNARKDLKLQDDKLLDERLKTEIALERQELRKLHIILSNISLENSLTMSHIQSTNKITISEFRDRYLENCNRLHEALAISDIYYPEMSESTRKIYGQSNIFWGNQERLLRADLQKDQLERQSSLDEVLKTGNEISDHSRNLQNKISTRAKALNEALHKIKH
jgi:hypothetical protein